jgi:hypothetical protein
LTSEIPLHWEERRIFNNNYYQLQFFKEIKKNLVNMLKVNSKPKIEIVVFKFEFIEQGSGKIIIN